MNGLAHSPRHPLFPLGRLLVTPAALSRLQHHDITTALRRHAFGDWGDVDGHDRSANDDALRSGARLLSAYRAASGTTFWVITEADRTSTTVLLPEDY